MSSEDLPIDIHYNKLLDWLISRRHCDAHWQSSGITVREGINTAIQDMPPIPEITQLLKGTYINYFHCRRIVELLKETDDGAKNIFGRYSSQRMKDWVDIIQLYELHGLYLAESAQMLTRNVNYEIPALKKQISKCQQTQTDCSRKQNDYLSNANEQRTRHKAQCKQLGIQGVNVRRELLSLVQDLPSTFQSLADRLSCLQPACHYYTDFLNFTLKIPGEGDRCLPLLRYLMTEGNTTVYQYKTGLVPTQVEEPVIHHITDEQPTSHSEEIDFGGDEIDFGDEGITLETEGIEWTEESAPNIQVIDDTMEPDQVKESTEGVARGNEALTLLDNSATQAMFIDELTELEAFIHLRLSEMETDTGLLSDAQFSSAPASLQVNSDTVQVMLDEVNLILQEVTSKRMQDLYLIRSSPRYVDRLAASVQQIMTDSEKSESMARLMTKRREEAEEEQTLISPKLDLLRQRTQELKAQIEMEISKKYKNRRVNIMGEINTV